MKEIGGYFELELPHGEEYHKDAIRLNTGRNAFEYVLRAKGYKKVYLPYYTCDVMLEPVKKLSLACEFYHIDETFRPIFDFDKIKTAEVFIHTNYFGLCDAQVSEVAAKCKNLIVDNAQAFFSKPLPGVDTFYSPRKFFGVPDGAYLYTYRFFNLVIDIDKSTQRFNHLLGRVDTNAESFYQSFVKNEETLSGQPIKTMSSLTKRILHSIDNQMVILARRNNFLYLHEKLGNRNNLKFDFSDYHIPMIYPYFVEDGQLLKNLLIAKKIFVPTYWPNVIEWAAKDSTEFTFANNIIALPIDQRYGLAEMKLIVDLIVR